MARSLVLGFPDDDDGFRDSQSWPHMSVIMPQSSSNQIDDKCILGKALLSLVRAQWWGYQIPLLMRDTLEEQVTLDWKQSSANVTEERSHTFTWIEKSSLWEWSKDSKNTLNKKKSSVTMGQSCYFWPNMSVMYYCTILSRHLRSKSWTSMKMGRWYLFSSALFSLYCSGAAS